MYLRELTVQYRLRRVAGQGMPNGPLTMPLDAARLFATLVGQEIVEVCGLLCLSARHDVLAYHELSRGTADHTPVVPRDVFRTALLAHATAVIVGHNHPSGNVEPSPEDRALTRALVAAGVLLGVELLDHVIVGADGRYYSFKEHRLL
jgi:DNA repair protein RadC